MAFNNLLVLAYEELLIQLGARQILTNKSPVAFHYRTTKLVNKIPILNI
jgi:hypothetical protein